MTLEDTDIKFECSQCGQRLAIEQSGAGLLANCPICEHPVTVPKDGHRKLGDFSESSRLSDSGVLHPSSSNHGFAGNVRPSFADPDEEEMREELVNSAMENGLLENDLSVAKTKIARLQQHLRKALDDCERLTESAAHTQAETKTLQAERQQMKADLALSRQKMAVWETQVAEARAKLSEMASALATAGSENAALLQELERKTAEHRDYHAEGEARLAKRDEALVAANTKAGEVIYELAAAEDEIGSLRQTRDQALEELETARAKIEELSPIPALLAAAETALAEEKDRANSAEARGASLEDSLNGIRTEADDLRRTLADNTTGRELLEVRARYDALNEEHNCAVTSLAERDSSLNALTVSTEKLKAELKTARALQEEAERRAEAALEDKALKDNDVLRGIIERQNSVIAESSRELRILRRRRYALRTAYALFGAALLALVIFALAILKPQLLGG